MINFTYKPFYRFVYRFGNLLVTPILLLYMLPAILTFSYGIGEIVYLFSLSVIAVYVNKLYLRLYKILPFFIALEGDKLVCSQYFSKNKIVVINLSEIQKLSGGIFEGKSKGLMKIEGKNVVIGFFHQLIDANIFITTILQRVPEDVYHQVEPKIKSRLES